MATDSNGRSESALQDLAERIEAADGPDREMDRDIMLAAVPCDRAPFRYWAPMNENTGHGAVDVERVYYAPHCAQAVAVPKFTASLDSALTLVPEGHDWILVDQRATYGTPFVRVKSGDDRVADWEGRAPTPALALCAAALRARHSQGSSL